MGVTVVGSGFLLACSAAFTMAVTLAALDGSWTTTLRFDAFGEGPLELLLAWALLPAAGWVVRAAIERELSLHAATSEATASTPVDGQAPQPAHPPDEGTGSPSEGRALRVEARRVRARGQGPGPDTRTPELPTDREA